MPEVRIKHEFDERAIPIGEVALNDKDIAATLPTIGKWGIRSGDDYYGTSNLTGEFILADGAFYFEIAIHEDEE